LFQRQEKGSTHEKKRRTEGGGRKSHKQDHSVGSGKRYYIFQGIRVKKSKRMTGKGKLAQERCPRTTRKGLRGEDS